MPFAPGFDLTEALDLLALSAIVEDGAGPPIPVPPSGWPRLPLFDSPNIGPFQNKWQLWRKTDGSAYAIAIRGTIPTVQSILEDVISLMIAAKGTVEVGPLQFDYNFSNDPLAGVHLGFALGALLLLKDQANGILAQLPKNGVTPGSSIYVTGHSQGAAVATLARSYLEHAADKPQGLNYKTYVYAQPKPGNDHYAEDFEARFSNNGLGFRVTNSLDWVPQVPFTFEFINDINVPNPISVLGSKPVLLTVLEKMFQEMRAIIEVQARAQLRVQALALAAKAAPEAARAGTPLLGGVEVPILPTLNFVNAGAETALEGTPCVGTQCQDAFFEHHATTYYGLLQSQRPRV